MVEDDTLAAGLLDLVVEGSTAKGTCNTSMAEGVRRRKLRIEWCTIMRAETLNRGRVCAGEQMSRDIGSQFHFPFP